MSDKIHQLLLKVPQITLMFWVIKIAATTLGETGGDALSMSLGLGYLLSTGIFAGLFIVLLVLQISADRYHPYLYWATILASTTVGTTLADYVDRSLGAVVGDFLDKPLASGGLDLSRFTASLVLLIFIAICIYFYRQDGRQLSSSSSSRPIP